MVTKREQQILKWIKENPSISQKELADRAHISRSSVAVHISNLIHKGEILGRQYVLPTHPYVVVLGAANIDIAGRPASPLVLRDSNPGTVSLSAGGSGRNISHNLALLGCDTRLISVFGNDAYAKELSRVCQSAGIDISGCATIPDAATSTYLFIMNEHGEMELAISDMSIYEQITPAMLEQRLDMIEHAALCVCDTNIPTESLHWLAAHVSTPLFCDPVSTVKATKLLGILEKFHTIKPNLLEAETLSGVRIHDQKSLEKAAQSLLDMGLVQVFVSLDEQGFFCANHKERYLIPCIPGDVVNTTGAGDAMMAAIAWAYLNGDSLVKQGLAGLGAASLTVEAKETINTCMSADALRLRMGKAKMAAKADAEMTAETKTKVKTAKATEAGHKWTDGYLKGRTHA